MATLELLESEMRQLALKDRSYVRLYSKGDSFGNELTEGTCVTCSVYMNNNNSRACVQCLRRIVRYQNNSIK